MKTARKVPTGWKSGTAFVLIFGSIIAVSVVLHFMYRHQGLAQEQEETPSVTPTIQVVVASAVASSLLGGVPRPKQWLNRPLPPHTRATSQEMTAFQGVLRPSVKIPWPYRPVDDPLVLGPVAAAQRLVEDWKEWEDMWQWEKVRSHIQPVSATRSSR